MEKEKPLIIVRNESFSLFLFIFSFLLGLVLIWLSREEGYIQFSSNIFQIGLGFIYISFFAIIMSLLFRQQKIYFFNDRIEIENNKANKIIDYNEIEYWKEHRHNKHTAIDIYIKDKFLSITSSEYNNISKIASLLTQLNLSSMDDILTNKRAKICTDKDAPSWILKLSMAFLICYFFSIFIFIYIKRNKYNAISKEKIILNATLSIDSDIKLYSHYRSSTEDTTVVLNITNTPITFESDENIFSQEQYDYIFNQLRKNEKVSLQILKVDYEYRIIKTKIPDFWYNHLRLGNIKIQGLKHDDNILIPYKNNN